MVRDEGLELKERDLGTRHDNVIGIQGSSQEYGIRD